MLRLLLRISATVVTFFVGLATWAAFAAVFGFGASGGTASPSYAPPPQPRTYSCPSKRYSRRPPEPPPPPAAPASPEELPAQMRRVVRAADGTVSVVESEAGSSVERR